MKTFLFLFTFLVASIQAPAQVLYLTEGQEPGVGDLKELSWITGFWTGTGLGGECEEVWMPEKDGQMIGTFRFWEDGKLVFSEFMNLVQEGDSFSLKLKHFGADLTPWEEKDEWTTFRLVELGENTVWFHGLTMERRGDELIYKLALTENGESSIEEFRFTKRQL